MSGRSSRAAAVTPQTDRWYWRTRFLAAACQVTPKGKTKTLVTLLRDDWLPQWRKARKKWKRQTTFLPHPVVDGLATLLMFLCDETSGLYTNAQWNADAKAWATLYGSIDPLATECHLDGLWAKNFVCLLLEAMVKDFIILHGPHPGTRTRENGDPSDTYFADNYWGPYQDLASAILQVNLDSPRRWQPPEVCDYSVDFAVADWLKQVTAVVERAARAHANDIKRLAEGRVEPLEKRDAEKHLRWLAEYQIGGMGYQEIVKRDNLRGADPRVGVRDAVSSMAAALALPLRACK